MDAHEVTLSKWQSVYFWATSNGYSFTNAGAGKGVNHPVHTLNWYDCVNWCNARSEREGKTPVYYTDEGLTAVYKSGGPGTVYVNWDAPGYRLPTEAEWEKASRGGLTGQRFPWGDVINHNLANYYGVGYLAYDLGPDGYDATWNDGESPYTSPVGTFAPNGYGLYDMSGNVWEWCWDWYGTPYVGGSDPPGPTLGSDRVYRGGSWSYFANYARCAFRDYGVPVYAVNFIGFRAVLSLGQP
jgi:formylglycine-generating enzyme